MLAQYFGNTQRRVQRLVLRRTDNDEGIFSHHIEEETTPVNYISTFETDYYKGMVVFFHSDNNADQNAGNLLNVISCHVYLQ